VITLIGWGALLLAFTALQFVFGPEPIEVALLGGAGAACVLVGLLGLAWRGPGPARTPARSWGTGLLATGVALAAFGAEAGLWLILIGAGVGGLGILLLAFEVAR
jgi:hypothetical protein